MSTNEADILVKRTPSDYDYAIAKSRLLDASRYCLITENEPSVLIRLLTPNDLAAADGCIGWAAGMLIIASGISRQQVHLHKWEETLSICIPAAAIQKLTEFLVSLNTRSITTILDTVDTESHSQLQPERITLSR